MTVDGDQLTQFGVFVGQNLAGLLLQHFKHKPQPSISSWTH